MRFLHCGGNFCTSGDDCFELPPATRGNFVVLATPPSQALVWPRVFCIHFLFCRPVPRRVNDVVKGTASPPDHLSYHSSAIVTCDTGHLSYTSVSCSPISSGPSNYGVSERRVFWWWKPSSALLSVVGLKRIWDQKLSSGLMSLTFITTHIFQFHVADTEFYRHASWLTL